MSAPAPTPDMIARARQSYVDGVTISKILAETDMSLGTLYHWLDGGPDEGTGSRLPRIARRRSTLGRRRKLPGSDRVSLVSRLWRTAERQVRDIEERLRLNIQQPDERERDARVLATMVKTLRDLRALQDTEEEPSAKDDGPANLDDFRRELARKIDGLIASEREGADRGSEG